MTGTLSPSIPTIGQPNSTEDADIKSALETLRDGLNAILNSDNTVMGMQSYSTIFASQEIVSVDLPVGTYMMGASTGATNPIPSAQSPTASPKFFYFDDSDYHISGKTLKLRLRAQIATNPTKPLVKFVVGLYPVTSAGSVDALTLTLGTVVPGSTIEFNEPAASNITQKEASDFTIPSDGAYMLGYTISGTLTNGSVAAISAQLQVRNA